MIVGFKGSILIQGLWGEEAGGRRRGGVECEYTLCKNDRQV